MTIYVKRSKAQMVQEDGVMLLAVANGSTLKAAGKLVNVGVERTRQRIMKITRLMRHLQALNPKYQAILDAVGGSLAATELREIRANPEFWATAVNEYGNYVNDPDNIQYDLERLGAERVARENYTYHCMGWAPPDPQIRKLMLSPAYSFDDYIKQYAYRAWDTYTHHVVFLNQRGEIAEEVSVSRRAGVLVRYLRERLTSNNAIFINGRLFKHGNLSYLQALTWSDVFTAERNGVAV